MIYLRNLDARRTAAVPVAPGWARLIAPGVTSRVPSQAVALPAVQRLLADARLRVVTEVTARPDAGEVLRRDMAAAIAAAEARELAALVAQHVRQHGKAAEATPRPYRRSGTRIRWSGERLVWLRKRLAAGASMPAIAAECGVSRAAVDRACRLHGLLTGSLAGYRPRSDQRAAKAPSVPAAA